MKTKNVCVDGKWFKVPEDALAKDIRQLINLSNNRILVTPDLTTGGYYIIDEEEILKNDLQLQTIPKYIS